MLDAMPGPSASMREKLWESLLFLGLFLRAKLDVSQVLA